MTDLDRRRFLQSAAGLTAGLALDPLRAAAAAWPAGRSPAKDAAELRITGIEVHSVAPPFRDFNATTLLRYQGSKKQYRTLYVLKTANGLEGYGESWGRAPIGDAELAAYRGTSAFDWLAATVHLPLNMAVYDLLGKHLGIPAWKLIGPRARSWVPVAFWTVSQPPRAMAEEVRQAVRLGYRWLKYHVDEIQNAVDQTAAMQEAAPRGFKVQYDFNSDQPLETVLPVLKALERFPVAGRIEDPITLLDRDGWRVIRSKCTIPIVGENAPVEFMLERLCDGYMISHRPVGPTAKIAAVAEQMGVPLIIQHTGGTINQAFLAHQAAVYRAATLEHVGLCHLWKDDVTAETMKVVGGSVALPEGPGLGVTLDREKLARYARTAPPELGRYLVRMRYAGGLTVYFRHDADAAGTPGQVLSKGSVRVPGPGPSYGNAVVTDFWDEAGSPEFERLWKETERGPVYVQGRER